MHPLQNAKFMPAILPAVIKDNAAFTASEIDCKGFDYATFIIRLGATDIAMAVLKLTEDDATGMGSAADVTGGDLSVTTIKDVYGTAYALPGANDDNKCIVMHVSLKKRKRFLKLAATAGDGSAGTYLAAECILQRGDMAPVTAATANVLNQISI